MNSVYTIEVLRRKYLAEKLMEESILPIRVFVSEIDKQEHNRVFVLQGYRKLDTFDIDYDFEISVHN